MTALVKASSAPLLESTSTGRPGWRHCTIEGGEVLWHGLSGLREERIKDIAVADSLEDLVHAMSDETGQFAIILRRSDRELAICDAVASIPVFLHTTQDSRKRFCIQPPDGSDKFIQVASKMFVQSGYTIGADTLSDSLIRLGCGQAAQIDQQGTVTMTRYRFFAPETGIRGTQAKDRSIDALASITLQIMQDLVTSADGRTILVPLSAGRDSRLIVSTLRELGYNAVKCFSYGLPGNHEAAMAKRIADKLGYEWQFIPQTPARMRRFFESERCADFERKMETLCAVPFQQDLFALNEVLKNGYADRSMIVVNGQSGDFITGNHIPARLSDERGRATGDGAIEDMIDATIEKHFALWRGLWNQDQASRLRQRIRQDLDVYYKEPSKIPAAALFERFEFENRQTKYVINGQRTYDYLGIEWRLPLWDTRFIDFWEQTPFSSKIDQKLYAEMLENYDWGGVWGRDWHINRKTIRPRSIAMMRLLCKTVFAVFPRRHWQQFDKRVFHWAIDPVANYAIAPYHEILLDNHGHRNAISWHARRYLQKKGFDFESHLVAA